MPAAVVGSTATLLAALALMLLLGTMVAATATGPVSLVAVTMAGGRPAAMWLALAVSGSVAAVAMGDGGATAAEVSREPVNTTTDVIDGARPDCG